MNKELAANTSLSHYRIVSKLGAGGMGEVYLAEDLRLGRQVALKVLTRELTKNPEYLQRFEREARAHAGVTPSSANLPLTMRLRLIPDVVTFLPVGAMPFNSP